MKKYKKLIIIASTLLLTVLVGVVFAAYTYYKNITINNKVGIIDIDSKCYYNYAAENTLSESDANYTRQSKLRTDTVCVLDGFVLKSNDTYTITGDLIFIKGKTYYTKNGDDYIAATVTTGDAVTPSTYYEVSKYYNGIATINSAYDSSLETLTPTISNDTTITISSLSITISCTIDAEQGKVSSATVSNDNYQAVIDADGLGMVIINTTKTTNPSNYSVINADTAITCSASENKKSNQNIYLSQLGLHFEFTSEIAVYVRIHIQDAWKRTRKYATNEKEVYILKDQISGQSPFTVSDEDWYYEASTNCVYLKEMYVPVQNEDGTYPSQAYTFDVNQAYFYNAISTSAYTEYIDVQVSFTVDIVQANRAKALWGVDPSAIVS